MSETVGLIETAIGRLQEGAGTNRAEGAQMKESRNPADTSPVAAKSSIQGARVPFDTGALRSAGLLAPESEAPELARQFRQIKRPLIARALGSERVSKGYRIMIASAMAGEGKTFTAINLAMSMALEMDLRVLLVDADVPKPHISRVLGIAEAPGLLDALRDPSIDVQRLVLPTDLPSLSVLPSGRFTDEANELLASRRMEQITAALGEQDRRRVIVFDSSPLLQTNESYALAQVAGQIVVVVRAESTPEQVLLDALETLNGHPCVSLVLNQSLRNTGSPYYYYDSDNEHAASVPHKRNK